MRLSRRALLGGLGAIWFLDGCLQLQPHMMSQAFFVSTFENANVALPSWLTGVEVHLDTWTGAHPLPWDLGIAVVQLAIGAALLSGRWVKAALALSVAWAGAVWVFGEGLGGLSLSGANAMAGAPGPALLYGLVALVLWPGRGDDAAGAAADSGLLRPTGSRLLWAGLWASTAALWLEYQSHMAEGPGGQLSGVGNGEPGWVSSLNHHLGSAVGSNGPALAALLAGLQLLVGLGVLMPALRRAALALAIALAAFYGLAGQDLGGLFTGAANDPGTGPVLALWALALWPRRPGPAVAVAVGAGGAGGGSAGRTLHASPPASAHDAGVTQRVAAGLGPDGHSVG